jgi:hypothetical protein
MAKVQLVGLFNPGLKLTEDYEINHAERILRMPNNGGWQLPKNSKFKFDFNNGIGYRDNQESNIGTGETANDSESDSAPKPD